MCGYCGCGTQADTTVLNLETGKETVVRQGLYDHDHLQDHDHPHDHDHPDDHDHHRPHDHHHLHGPAHHRRREPSTVVDLEARILAKNDALAERNRAWFNGREILALNLVSSPGAGKTSLLERTIRDLSGDLRLFVIEGDQATANDGERIRAAGRLRCRSIPAPAVISRPTWSRSDCRNCVRRPAQSS